MLQGVNSERATARIEHRMVRTGKVSHIPRQTSPRGRCAIRKLNRSVVTCWTHLGHKIGSRPKEDDEKE
jgi:hypothetical protein